MHRRRRRPFSIGLGQQQQRIRKIRFRTKIVSDTYRRRSPTLLKTGGDTNDLENCELTCHINYGNSCKVQVQYSSEENVCAFAWKRKRRNYLSSFDTFTSISAANVHENEQLEDQETDEREFCMKNSIGRKYPLADDDVLLIDFDDGEWK